jgi:hypothetical protein
MIEMPPEPVGKPIIIDMHIDDIPVKDTNHIDFY